MHALRHIAVNTVIWATSASVLMASTPVLACLCPPGELKAALFHAAPVKAPCCGHGSCGPSDGNHSGCCKARAGAKAGQGCAASAEDSANRSQDSPAFVKSTCQKV